MTQSKHIVAEEAAVRGLDDVRELATEMRDVNTGKTGPQWDRKVKVRGEEHHPSSGGRKPT